jgi:hypothetical protein
MGLYDEVCRAHRRGLGLYLARIEGLEHFERSITLANPSVEVLAEYPVYFPPSCGQGVSHPWAPAFSWCCFLRFGMRLNWGHASSPIPSENIPMSLRESHGTSSSAGRNIADPLVAPPLSLTPSLRRLICSSKFSESILETP